MKKYRIQVRQIADTSGFGNFDYTEVECEVHGHRTSGSLKLHFPRPIAKSFQLRRWGSITVELDKPERKRTTKTRKH